MNCFACDNPITEENRVEEMVGLVPDVVRYVLPYCQGCVHVAQDRNGTRE